jgi:hypothetical protein
MTKHYIIKPTALYPYGLKRDIPQTTIEGEKGDIIILDETNINFKHKCLNSQK